MQDYLAGELQNQFDRLTNQARFVQMIVERKLSISGRKKVDIVADLKKLEFRAFPKKIKAKEEGETEEALEDPDAELPGNVTDYDYLLGMSILSLTKEKVCVL